MTEDDRKTLAEMFLGGSLGERREQVTDALIKLTAFGRAHGLSPMALALAAIEFATTVMQMPYKHGGAPAEVTAKAREELANLVRGRWDHGLACSCMEQALAEGARIGEESLGASSFQASTPAGMVH